MKKFFYLILLLVSFPVFTQNDNDGTHFAKLAFKKYVQKDYNYAMTLIEKAIEIDDKNPYFLLLKAKIGFDIFGPQYAINIIENKLDLFTANELEFYYELSCYYQSLGNLSKAEELIDKAINETDNDTLKYSCLNVKANIKSNQRDFNSAIDLFHEILNFNPNNIAALNNLSMAYDEIGEKDLAIIYLKKVISLDENSYFSFVNLGFIYSQTDSIDLAIEYFDKAASIKDDDPLLYNNLGYAYYKKGNYIEALSNINKSISMYPTNPYAYRNLGLVYLAQEKHDEACKALNYAKEIGFDIYYGNEVNELLEVNCATITKD